GEQDDQMAPIEAAASALTTLSGMLGRMPTTRSPTFTPASRSMSAARAISSRSSLQPTRRLTLSSPQNTSAVPGPALANRFSGKVRPAPEKEPAFSRRSASSKYGAGPLSPSTPVKSHSALQTPPGASMEKRCSSLYPPNGAPVRDDIQLKKVLSAVWSARDFSGVHNGSVIGRSWSSVPEWFDWLFLARHAMNVM